MAQSTSQVKLVPYTIDSIVDKTNETPKGVSLYRYLRFGKKATKVKAL